MNLPDRIQDLNYNLLKLSSLVETNIKDAFSAIEKKDLDKSKTVVNVDSKINMMEVEIEKEVNEIIEKFHPTDSDLRYLLAALKINNELERIGDYATNIARNTQFMVENPDLELPKILAHSAETLTSMLNDVINAFILSDEAKAFKVIEMDDIIDNNNREIFTLFKEKAKSNSEFLRQFIVFTNISRYVERAADHTTNIAEDIIFQINGKIVRHDETI
jgi:phosphate transport system protein|tara:strand:- start:59 stop:712 length:654 start_codon:yes stop_codon:yes gene_type:complete